MTEFLQEKRLAQLLKGASDYLKKVYRAPKKSDSRSEVKFSAREPLPEVKFSARDPLAEDPVSCSIPDRYSRSVLKDAVAEFRASMNAKVLLKSLEKVQNQTFVECMLVHMQKQGLGNTAVYRAAQLDRRLFSKILSDRNYKPAKDTALAIVLALRLDPDQARDLLDRAGYTLSHSNQRDIVIEYFISEKVYDLNDINALLDRLGLKVIGR